MKNVTELRIRKCFNDLKGNLSDACPTSFCAGIRFGMEIMEIKSLDEVPAFKDNLDTIYSTQNKLERELANG